MKCRNCGSEITEGSAYCPICGARSEGARVSALREAFSSQQFLSICILVTIAAVFQFKAVFAILLTVAAWITYSNAKSKTEPLKGSGYKFFHAIFKIVYIFAWVGAVLLILGGFFAVFMLTVLRPVALSWLGSIVEYSSDYSIHFSDLIAQILRLISSTGMGIVAVVAVLMSVAAGVAVIAAANCIFIKKFADYFGALEQIAVKGDSCNDAPDHSGTAVRMLIYGILIIIGNIGSVFKVSLNLSNNMAMHGVRFNLNFGGIGGICLGAAFIAGYMMIKEFQKKHQRI